MKMERRTRERYLYPEEWKSGTLLFLRLVLAGILLYYGIPKILYPQDTMAYFAGVQIAGWLGPVAGVTEVIGALLLIAGLWTRVVSLALAATLLIAIFTVQLAKGMDPRFQRDVVMVAALLIFSWAGPGKYAFDKPKHI
jgi:putative oxidoreductase